MSHCGATCPAYKDVSLTYPARTGLQIRVAGRRIPRIPHPHAPSRASLHPYTHTHMHVNICVCTCRKEIGPPAAPAPPPWCLRKHAVHRKLPCAALPAWTDTSLTYPAHTGLQIRVAGRRMRLLSCRRQAPCAGRGLCLGLSHFPSLSNAASVDWSAGGRAENDKA
jgi:hypothetical protein